MPNANLLQLKLAIYDKWRIALGYNLGKSQRILKITVVEHLTLPRLLTSPWPPDLERSWTAEDKAILSVRCSWVAAACARFMRYGRGGVLIKEVLATAWLAIELKTILAIVAESSLTATDLPDNLPLSCSCSAASQTTCLWVSAAIAKDCYDMTCFELDQKMGVQTDMRARVIHTDPKKKRKKMKQLLKQTNIKMLTRQLWPNEISHTRRTRREAGERHVRGHLKFASI